MSASSNGSFNDTSRKYPGQGQGSSKNIPCRHWMNKGHCDLGSDCKFGHGDTTAGGQYKTKMCKSFLASGTCPIGPSCHFAHGGSELRSVGWPGGGSRYPPDNIKTQMCKNWTETGSCSYGDKCSFAHSEEQIRSGREQRIISQNPLYKTQLCKMFAEEDFCELGDNCHFAHGSDELRVLKPLEKTDFSNDPLYKTQLCNKWEEGENLCEYGDSCRFAHGNDELRIVKSSEVHNNMSSASKHISPQYKTILCNQPDCKFGSANCNFAHSQDELRTVQQNLAEINPNYKGTLCKYFMSTGQCEFGSICQYAHGDQELRKPSQHQPMAVQGPHLKQNYNQSYLNSYSNSPQYKTQICKNFQDSGHCDFGSHCQFAHGPLELRTLSDNLVHQQAQQMINPGPFKAPVQVTRVPPRVQELCKSWLQTGMCTIRGQCGAAHSLNELSAAGPVTKPHQVQPCRNLKDKGHCPYGNNCQFSHSLQDSPTVKPVKVVLCQDFNNGGHCDKGSSCTFAHGLMELHEYRTKQVPNYRTTLCQTWNTKGTCMYGETCMYAHGSHQLRNKFVTGGASVGGSGHFVLGGGGSPGHFDFGASGMPDCKRVRI